MAERYSPKEMLAKLVAFPTVSRDSNLELIDWVEEYLSGHGVECRRVYNDEGDKANLYALVGPESPGGVILSGHTDVVPIDGQEWDTDPFELVEKNGRLYGRGSCDMKGFDALALALVPEMLEAGLKRPIQIALSYDEEVGCLGAPRMIREMRQTLPPASAVIVGEPTMMQTVTGHKGVVGMTTHVRGFEVHSSLVHTGVSAVMTAAKLIGWLEAQMAANKAAAPAPSDDISGAAFTPPYTTLHVGVIHGGTAHNITAKHCEFSTDIRVIPGEDVVAWRDRYLAHAAEVEAEIRKIRPEAGIDVHVRSLTPGCRKEENGAAEALVRAITGDNGEHVVAYGTEAGQFQDEGYSTVICGPGSIAQAHQANEYVDIAQLDAGEAFMRKLIARLRQ
ncbi:acetylornithine deacetylase [bacterium]|nr:acetylornithine deacetylase [bacterium]